MIDGVNILAMFYAYSEANRLQQAEMRLLVKNDAKKILSLSAIFVLKKQKENLGAGPFVCSTSVQQKMYSQVMQRLYHGGCVSNRVQRKVQKIIKGDLLELRCWHNR